MDFQPLYLADRVHQTDHESPEYRKDKLNLINKGGSAGIVTLWANPLVIWNKLREHNPSLFGENSPLVALTSLYGNGLPQMLANLAHNPQVQYLAVTGNDLPVVPSSQYLADFLAGRVTEIDRGGMKMLKLGDSEFAIDAQLKPDMFRHLKVQRFQPSDLEAMVNFIGQQPSHVDESQRLRVPLIEPKFSDYHSDITSHNITANTPLEAWMEVMYHLDRFGVNFPLAKGTRRGLLNLDVNVTDPSFESEEALRRFGFDPSKLRVYQQEMLKSKVPENTRYTYGNRLTAYWGADALAKIGEQFREDLTQRHGFVSLWDTGKDLLEGESAPCFTDAYFVNRGGKLMMTAGFRTHNAVSAWLQNIYGLRAVQERVAEYAGLEPGQLNVRSRWIGIDPESAGTVSALKMVSQHRKAPLVVNDPRGYFTVRSSDGKIVAEHYSPTGDLLTRYTGRTAMEVKDQLRHARVISDPDHAMWIGYNLARAHSEVHGNSPDF
ncbi:MAG: hypothetical protein AABX10_00680 [Nanoarchaeota archaeon]